MSKVVDYSRLVRDSASLVPVLLETSHKGNSGRIGIFGGSVEFSGAPYFAGISALKTGADLVYVFTASSAAPSIKSYSPELMVLPFLDSDDAATRIRPWLKKLHSILLGPGLGRHDTIYSRVKDVIDTLKTTPTDTGKYRPLVFDADAIHFLTHHQNILKDYPGQVFLTPNTVEFDLLVNVILGHEYEQPTEKLMKQLSKEIGKDVTIVLKGNIDLICDSKMQLVSDTKGSLRRCGGQGDIMSGILATFAAWAALREWADCSPSSSEVSDNILAAYAASFLTRTCSRIAFATHSRSMLATDMIKEIPSVFKSYYDFQFHTHGEDFQNTI
ncbi:ATP-dependent (S)-NAD(P)H-hydrate dehydratase [Cimex lectularius]|uniref:ATP-dependent (S)-NAD(P)H-hydrate dehydratase n=1 Tax=Cimex lectularius TaxID=79782 RepID=A0A8I6S0H2_CIMLE|nr:ATP-dependent (S)-NAD(P)H-hydrate dehydratase [Cimex lectularius]XP_014255890.1 ATP-dependent (S)-NAD(P)H-hydrate dehydratase [Cimex lectularius]XP_014255891.1 ATP-dependent (S)-NAD(P)H-hydrate dehydratase [Cimex lectularius]XP_014255893.1 ATP-dependent (S)-NAD(P)H-hydrate dehydratase [Cimex lectularius]XP_024080952.1 ATP-dependent (S)-NAD(P)H-hydrate dehydratase [Cimex lectularius]